MPELECQKKLAGSLPPDRAVIDLMEHTAWFKRIPLHNTILWKFTHPRNYEFHKKYFALLDFAFGHWEPSTLHGKRYAGVVPLKSKSRFRKDLTVLAGYFEQEIRLDGSLRVVAKSISWSSMSEEEFVSLYESTKDVIWDRIFSRMDTYNREAFEDIALELSSF